MLNLHPPTAGTLAQLVEQRTENPCVPGSIPGGTTQKTSTSVLVFFIAFSPKSTATRYAKKNSLRGYFAC